jgi:O-acetyl-ADP-ribose deacetylase (regulator of RNase III)
VTQEGFYFIFRDIDAEVVDALQDAFVDAPWCSIEQGDILDEKADAIVSPANSYGMMDGGIDLAYSLHFGWELQKHLQDEIGRSFDGFLPVGAAVVVPTNETRIPWLISAPTMETPQAIERTRNVFLAMRAVIKAAFLHNSKSTSTGATPIHDILIPGLGTGIGEMDPIEAAAQMWQAAVQSRRARLV